MNDLVSRQSGQLTGPDEYTQGLMAGFEPPKVTIGMGSPQQGKVGHFNFTTGESLQILPGVVLLGIIKGWVLYGGKGKKPARCASDDGLVPAMRIANPISTTCDACPANKWGEDELKDMIMQETGQDAKGEKPICNNTRSVTLADSNGFPLILTVKTHNSKIVDDFLSLGVLQNAKRLKVHPLACAFDITLEAIPGQGNRYKMKFENWRGLTNEELAERQVLFNIFGGKKAEKIVSEIHARQDQENSNWSGEEIS
jgi:hypothetical protein